MMAIETTLVQAVLLTGKLHLLERAQNIETELETLSQQIDRALFLMHECDKWVLEERSEPFPYTEEYLEGMKLYPYFREKNAELKQRAMALLQELGVAA